LNVAFEIERQRRSICARELVWHRIKFAEKLVTVGAWRSLVAHTLGVRVVAGSNPAAPTNPISS
jgi:hypothetical protein